ncbi:hypothetical protein JB92DRAFT_3278072 [Gautieria morchelliformis]|nr:hypothetical protein JB92DRAFT_3278072 [Gautieria morchelliformis]
MVPLTTTGESLMPKVQVLLTDFNNAMIIRETGKKPHSVNFLGQGTPAFIADVLARPSLAPVQNIFYQYVQDLNKAIIPHRQTDRDSSDKQFFQQLATYKCLKNKHVSHQAIHDAELIFWVIVCFMVHANPKGSDSYKNIEVCSETFDAIVAHKIGKRISTRKAYFESFTGEEWEEMLPEKLSEFSVTLHELWRYFSFPWYGIQVPPEHQFHAHNFLR